MSHGPSQEVMSIEDLLREYYPERTIKSIIKLTGDASSRKYFRIKMDEKSYIACLEGDLSDEESSFVSVQKILNANLIRVPEVIDYQAEAGLILEEDLGDSALLNILARTQSHQELVLQYEACIDQLILIHKIDFKKYPKAKINQYEFDEPKLSSEVGVTIENFIRFYLKAVMSVEEEGIIRAEFSEVNSILAAQKQVLCHRDYHSRNIMYKNNELVIIDFQDARPGPPAYDVVSILEDSYFTINQEMKAELKKRYWEKFLLRSGLVDRQEDFEYQYNLMACQRIFKAIGSFSYIYRHKNDARYLKYIGSSFDNLMLYMSKVPQLKNSRTQLRKYYYDS